MVDSELGGITEVTVHESASVTWQRKTSARRPVGPNWGAILPFQRLVGNFWRHFCHAEWRVPLAKAAVEHQQCMR